MSIAGVPFDSYQELYSGLITAHQLLGGVYGIAALQTNKKYCQLINIVNYFYALVGHKFEARLATVRDSFLGPN